MIAITKMIVAWMLAIVATGAFNGLMNGRSTVLRGWDGILGLGLVVGLPMLIFACAVALPLALVMSRVTSPVVAMLLYPVLFAGVAWLISAPLLPEGWKGAQQAMVLFAFILGVIWSLLNLLVPPSTASA